MPNDIPFIERNIVRLENTFWPTNKKRTTKTNERTNEMDIRYLISAEVPGAIGLAWSCTANSYLSVSMDCVCWTEIGKAQAKRLILFVINVNNE